MPRPVQLHVMLSEEEMSSLRDRSPTRSAPPSPTRCASLPEQALSPREARQEARSCSTAAPSPPTSATCARSDTSSTSRPTPSTRSPRRFASLAEAMGGVSYGLDEVRRDAAEVRRQAAELTGMPVVFGE